MEIEIIDTKLIITPVTADEVKHIYALAAAWTAYDSVMNPISGEPLREEGLASARSSGASETKQSNGKWHIHPSNRQVLKGVLADSLPERESSRNE